MRMILNAANLASAIVFAIVSIWGMNLSDNHTTSYPLFLVVSSAISFVMQIVTQIVRMPHATLFLPAGDCRQLFWLNFVVWYAHGMVHLAQSCQ